MNSIRLSPDEKALTQQLAHHLRQLAKPSGRLSFVEYMQQALYAPGLGYYQNGLQKFGPQGDFITAPEMGDLLASALVSSFSAYWQTLPERERIMIEFGGGSGALAEAMIRLLSEAGMPASQYLLLEPSAALQQQQLEKTRQTAQKAGTQVSWIADLPAQFCGILLANEVIDAMPCERICRLDKGWCYLDVAWSETASKGWHWQPGRVFDQPLPAALEAVDKFPENYATEVRYLHKPWLQMISQRLTEGLVCLIDYGYSEPEYYHPQRIAGTLMSFIRHHQTDDVFLYPGLQDVSVHVDFTALIRDAMAVGFKPGGYTTQAGFLLDSGILYRLEEQMMDASVEQRLRLSQQIQKLMLPGQMGETIKVLMLSKGQAAPATGFGDNEQSHRL